jgi:hypothetical protein
MNTWALSDKAESCDFQLRILKKRTGLGSHPSSPKTIVLQAILEHVRSSEVIDSTKQQNGEKPQKRRSEVHDGHTE